jgi:hypothetical protein
VQVDWNHPWSELPKPPTEDVSGIIIHTGEPPKKMLGLFKSNDGGRTVFVQDEKLKKVI